MKAGILYQDGEIRCGTTADPEIRESEVLLETGFAGICGTDVHIFHGEFHDRVAYPAILGHEFGGIVREAGRQVKGYRAGDRVAVDPIISCHNCLACHTGHINACRTLKLLGVDLAGGYGQYVAVPSDRLFPLPDSVPMKFVPMVEMYGLGNHILARGKVQPGETVAILGAGRLGLSVLDVLCHSVSPGLTLITDMVSFRLETARQIGADLAIDVLRDDPVVRAMELTQGVGVDCVIECIGHFHEIPGQDNPMQQAVGMIRNGGRIVTCGMGAQHSPIHFKTLVVKEAEIIASRVTRGEFPRALRQMAKGILHPEKLVTGEAPLSEITAAFVKADRDPATIKMVLDVQRA